MGFKIEIALFFLGSVAFEAVLFEIRPGDFFKAFGVGNKGVFLGPSDRKSEC